MGNWTSFPLHRYLICVSGNSIKVLSTITEECIHVLWSHRDLVTGIELNPNNLLQLYSCSLDGTVKLWDFIDGILIKTFVVGKKVFGLYTISKKDCVCVITPIEDYSETFKLMSLKLPKSTRQECDATELTVLFADVSQSPKSTAVGRNGEYIVTVKGLILFVYYFKNEKILRFPLSATSKRGANNIFTVVTCHPVEDCIATGHKDGKIRLWRNFNHKQGYTYSSLHWHHDSVADLAFSAQGTLLFSGGVESVLVQWSHSLEHKKEFLPRLGAAIEHIATSPDGSLLCTSHLDNKITIIDASLKVTGIIQGLVKGNDVKTGLIFDPRTKALVLNGKPGHLQFYSLQDDKQLYNLDIVQQEFVNQTTIQHVDLVKAAFDAKGNWLATVEELERNGTDHLEVQMKFWEYNIQLQSFALNTTINLPHEDQITCISFRCGCDSEKDSPTLVTTGNDGLFKVWTLEDNSYISRQTSGWTCDFLGSYHGFKATACSFSEDGSLLAVSFEDIITIWESSSWELKHTFCEPPGKIRNLCFGRMSSSKYLLASTDNGFITCWDLLTCNLTWKAQLNAFVLQPDCASENIAAFSFISGSSTMFIFNPADPVPLYVHADVCQGCVQWALFVPRDEPEVLPLKGQRWLNKSQLYFLTGNQELMTFSTKSSEESLKPLCKQLSAGEFLPFTPFFMLMEKKWQQKQVETMQLQEFVSTGCKTPESFAVKELLHTPAHVLPPAVILCSLLVDSLLIFQQHKSTENYSKDLDVESESAEEDSDEDTMKTDDLSKATESHILPVHSSETPHKLLKSEQKELRRIRRGDFSWVPVL
ncbi:WD repeat-containing protein 75 isoform X2 [Hyla sarda]|uniref:WD repeat-containing protein 75 isoform X2 n=1 Tax=Hyla sarda TaxID=327740 RepID=UPI0024C28179|nr:WD repeat-containing protein 75 isoform X2 [Hyla sarda]